MRYLLLDRITRLEPPALATGIKCVSLSDDVFDEHFPGHPVLPGALLIEAFAQLGGVLLEATLRERNRPDLVAVLTMVDRAKFRRAVRPGDRLELSVQGLVASEDGGQVAARATVDGALVGEAELAFALATVKHPALLAKRRERLQVWLSGTLDGT